ncbi:MAG TPA: hypothetical protein VGN41_03345 [Streptosporangiaceae bacterium]
MDHRPRSEAPSGALSRVLPGLGGIGTIDRLAALSGSDFTSVMLEVVRRRAARETPASVLRRYERDRFTRPGGPSWRSMRLAEDTLLRSLPGRFEVVTLAPLVPLGAHSVLATVSQDKVVTAVRACEVAADPTNGLTLEAAARRARAGDDVVRLAAVQRVVRAQVFRAAGASAHFSLLGLVTAGRDQGSHRFERAALAEHVRFAVGGLAAARLTRVQVALTPLSDAGRRIAAAVTGELADVPAEMVEDPTRQRGRGYYRDLCFKVHADTGGELEEIGDGGFTDWTMRLTESRKERLLISGLGLDQLAGVISSDGTG